MKKLTCILICVLLAAAFAVTAFAAKNAEMTLDTAQKTVSPGETVAFTVSLAAMEDCRSAGFTLSYDETVFEFLDGSCTLKNTLLSRVENKVGVFAYGQAAAVSGEIFSFRLKVKDSAAAGSYTVDAKGSVRDGSGAVSTKVNGVSVAVTVEADEPTTAPTVAETVPPKETKPAPTEGIPTTEETGELTKETEPATEETTVPALDTALVPDETEPEKDTQITESENPVYTIGAEPEERRNGFPWWTLVAVGIIAVGGIVFAYIRRKK